MTHPVCAGSFDFRNLVSNRRQVVRITRHWESNNGDNYFRRYLIECVWANWSVNSGRVEWYKSNSFDASVSIFEDEPIGLFLIAFLISSLLTLRHDLTDRRWGEADGIRQSALKVTESFCYLGRTLSRDVSLDKEIDAIFAKANAVFGALLWRHVEWALSTVYAWIQKSPFIKH